MKRTKKSLKFQKSMNVMQGLVNQGYEMNWPKASGVAKNMRLERGMRDGKTPPAVQRHATSALKKYR